MTRAEASGEFGGDGLAAAESQVAGDALSDGTEPSEYSERALEVDFCRRWEEVAKGFGGRRYVGNVWNNMSSVPLQGVRKVLSKPGNTLKLKSCEDD
jgi:hypothetical protein